MKGFFYFAISILLLASCTSHKQYHFGKLNSFAELQAKCDEFLNVHGRIMRQGNFAEVFNLYNLDDKSFTYYRDSIDIYKLSFRDDKSLELFCFENSDFRRIKTFKGKYHPKKNYFEITLSKKRLITLVINHINNDKVRIGINEKGELYINKLYDSFGSLPFFAVGDEYDYAFVPETATNYRKPKFENEKWGFIDRNNDVVIPFQYDSVSSFMDDGLVRAKQNGKWGFIDKQGKAIVPFAYKYIDSYDFRLYKVCNEYDKVGLVDYKGKSIIPCKYDDFKKEQNGYFITKSSGKSGLISLKFGIVYPPIFDRIKLETSHIVGAEKYHTIADVSIGNRNFIADINGYLYEYKLKTLNSIEKLKIFNGVKYDISPKVYYKRILENP